MWLAPTTTTTTTVTSLLLLRRFNKSVGRAARLLIHQTSFFIDHLHTTTFNSSSKFGGAGTFISHQQQQQANNLHTTTSSSSSKFVDTFILQTYEPSVDLGYEPYVDLREYGQRKEDIKMFILSTGSGSGTTGEEDKDDDDDQKKNKKKKKKKKKKTVFKLDEDLGFSAIYKDFQLQDSIRMVGSCNGIICLYDPELKWPQLRRDVYLWNPATRHFRILPESIHIEEQMTCNAFKDFVGFGFDDETQDYKVLRISPFISDSSYRGGDGCMCKVQVYSLSSDSWRLLDGIDSLPVSPTKDVFQNRQGTYLNGTGCCFFLVSKPIDCDGMRELMLLSFDFNKEIFTITQLPECYPECYPEKLVLSCSGGKDLVDIRSALSYFVVDNNSPVIFRTPRIDFASGYVFTTDKIALYSTKGGGGGGGGGGYWHYSMWVMNEQDSRGVVDYKDKSWAKFREFRINTKTKLLYSEPRCVSNDGELALISTLTDDNGMTDNGRKKLMLFNLVTEKATKDFTIGVHRDCRAAYVYNESQVSIMGAANVLLRWQLPTPGTTYYKLNLDAPYTGGYTNFGIGLCLTSSDTGGCIGVRSLKTCVLDPEEGEAEALFQAIKWAKKLELSPIIIESESEYCVSFFMGDVDDDYNSTYWSWRESSAGSILREAKLLLKSSENSISFQYCSRRRRSNYVLEIASKLGRDETTWSCKDWKADSPGEVVMSLSMDLGVET